MDLVIRIEPQSRRLAAVRRVIDVWLEAHELRAGPVHLIATELLTNAFAVTPAGARVELELRRTPGTVEIDVTDHGPGLDLASVTHADASQSHGRGLAIVRELADQVLVRREAGATSVTASVDTAGSTPNGFHASPSR